MAYRNAKSTRDKRWAVVLAGGDGQRLQELTMRIAGAPIPKQYCRILGDRSLLETTLARTERWVPPARTMVVVNRDHLDVARHQLRGLPARNVLVQPRNRDTGPGLLFTLLQLARRDPDAIAAAFPSDHYVGNETGFLSYVHQAADMVAVNPAHIVLLGIRPDRPEAGFGYIVPESSPFELGGADRRAAFRVRCFQEKPSIKAAAALLSEGGLWNSFVMVFHVGRMLDLLRARMPAEFERMHAVGRDAGADLELYENLSAWNFSSRFLSCVPEHLVVIPVEDVHWDDCGTPEAIHRTIGKLERRPAWVGRGSESVGCQTAA